MEKEFYPIRILSTLAFLAVKNDRRVMVQYRIGGNIGGQLNLAVWRLGKRLSNLNPSNLSAIYANKGTRN